MKHIVLFYYSACVYRAPTGPSPTTRRVTAGFNVSQQRGHGTFHYNMRKIIIHSVPELLNDQMTKWLNDQMTKWMGDRMTGSFADDWQYGIFDYSLRNVPCYVPYLNDTSASLLYFINRKRVPHFLLWKLPRIYERKSHNWLSILSSRPASHRRY